MLLRYISHQLFFEELIHLPLCVPVLLCVIQSTTVVRKLHLQVGNAGKCLAAIELLPSEQFLEARFPRVNLTPLSYVNGTSFCHDREQGMMERAIAGNRSAVV